jgi:hypothetical protein
MSAPGLLNGPKLWGDRTGVRVLLGWARLLAAVAIVGQPARAAEGGGNVAPLMVAAEIEPGVGLDAEDARRVIAEELHRKVVAPASAPGVDAQDLLLVSVGRARTVVSFRASADEHTWRAIPTPADRAGRLRAVAWLAGNLARDQVSPIVLAAVTTPTEADTTITPTTPVSKAESQVAATSSPSTTQPTPMPPGPDLVAPSTDTTVVQPRKAPTEPWSEDPRWTIGLSGGPTMSYLGSEGGAPANFTPSWQGEVQHRPLAGWLLGGAIDFGPTPLHRLGFAATAGLLQRWRDFRFEETLGVGVETGTTTSTSMQYSSLMGVYSTTETSTSSAFYARAFVTVAHPLWRSWDVVLRVGGHSNLEGTFYTAFVASSLGVRLRLP